MDDYVLKWVGAGTVVATTTAAVLMMKKQKPFNNSDFSEQAFDAEVINENKLFWIELPQNSEYYGFFSANSGVQTNFYILNCLVYCTK